MFILHIRKLNLSKIVVCKIRILFCMVTKSLYHNESRVLFIPPFVSHILESACGKLPTFQRAVFMIVYGLKVNSWPTRKRSGLCTCMWRLFGEYSVATVSWKTFFFAMKYSYSEMMLSFGFSKWPEIWIFKILFTEVVWPHWETYLNSFEVYWYKWVLNSHICLMLIDICTLKINFIFSY